MSFRGPLVVTSSPSLASSARGFNSNTRAVATSGGPSSQRYPFPKPVPLPAPASPPSLLSELRRLHSAVNNPPVFDPNATCCSIAETTQRAVNRAFLLRIAVSYGWSPRWRFVLLPFYIIIEPIRVSKSAIASSTGKFSSGH